MRPHQPHHSFPHPTKRTHSLTSLDTGVMRRLRPGASDAAIAASLPPRLAKFAGSFATPDEVAVASKRVLDPDVPELRKMMERQAWTLRQDRHNRDRRKRKATAANKHQ
jgi:hypothetical protein